MPTVPLNLSRIASEVDLQGVAAALSRVHDTYGMNISEIAEGYLLGTRYSQPLSTEDCFEIGQQMQGYGDNYYAMVWLREALSKCQSVEEEADIIDVFHPILYNSTHRELALALVNRLLAIEPSNHEAQEFKQVYEESVGVSNVTYADVFQTKFYRRRDPNNGLDPKLRTRYNQLCRGATDKSPERLAALKCRFVYDNSTFSRIAPFKLEEVYKNPDIVVFHDVITDAEIAIIQKITKPLMKRAAVSDSKTGKSKFAEYRISKSAFVNDKLDPCLAKISRRITAMTGLQMKHVEALQVVNYGLGGQYEPHHDYFVHPSKEKYGNRIATVMFYMSNVQQGGDTVFVNLDVSVRPLKGSAIVWYNLHSSGAKDSRLRHAACPVIVGSKWVCNKWIHAHGQEFVRPCSVAFNGPKDSNSTNENTIIRNS